MALFGIKNNKCFQHGVQGVVNVDDRTAESSGEVFTKDGPENNTLYVARGHSKISFTSIPATPDADYNFSITFQNLNGFYGTFEGNFNLFHSAPSEPGVVVDIKLDNPDFDLSNNYTVIHLHVWFDGINYCGKIDGYE